MTNETEPKRGLIGRACKEPGCHRIVTEHKRRFCAEHSSEEKTHRLDVRVKERLPLYNTPEGIALSDQVLREEPICQKCGKRLAVLVHHIKPARQYPELQLERSNLESACTPCHNRESQRVKTEEQHGA